MKANEIKTIVFTASLLTATGCAVPHHGQSWSSWSKTADNAEQERLLSNSPEDAWNTLPLPDSDATGSLAPR